MSDENNGGAVVSSKPLHSSQSSILAIVNMINYLQPEVVLLDSNAGQLLQMCKAELLQTLAVEATTSALRHGAAQINATFARCHKPLRARRCGNLQWRRRRATTKFRSHDRMSKRDEMILS